MALTGALKWLWDMLKWWTNVVSNTAVSWLQATKWAARMGIKAALLWFFPVASLWYYGLTRALQHIPRWVGEKYKAIHEKTLWRLENVLSFSGGAKDIKNAFVWDSNDVFDIESNGGDGSAKVARIQAKADIEKAKIQHISEIEKLKMEERSKNADRKFEMSKINKDDKRENISEKRKYKFEDKKLNNERLNNKEKNQHDLAIVQAAHETTRHGVEQTTEQRRIDADGKIQEKRIDSGDRRHEADQKLQEKRIDSADKQYESNQMTQQKQIETDGKIQEKQLDSGDRRHEADQKLQEKKLDTEATTAQETLKQETEREKNKTEKEIKEIEKDGKIEEKKLDSEIEKYKIEQEKLTKEFEANQALAQHRLTINKEKYIAKLENEKNTNKKEDIDPTLWAQYDADVKKNIQESEDMLSTRAATTTLEEQTKILSKQIGFLEAIRDDQKDATLKNTIQTSIKSLQSEVNKIETEIKSRNKSLSLPTTIKLSDEEQTISDLKNTVDNYDDKTNKKIIENQINEATRLMTKIDTYNKMTNDSAETLKLSNMKDEIDKVIKKLNNLNKKPHELGKDKMETLEDKKKNIFQALDVHIGMDKSAVNKWVLQRDLDDALEHKWKIDWHKSQASDTEKVELQKWINELTDKISKARKKL